jgi:hypothetical protein
VEVINKILLAFKEDGLLYKFIEHGIKPVEIKNAIIEIFDPYFENKQILAKFSIEILVPEFINFLKIKEDKWLFAIFEKYYENFREAKIAYKEKCFESFSFWHPKILDSNSRFWSIYNLQFDKNLLPDAEKIFECFRNIGDIIEGLKKPYLKNLLCQIKIINGFTPSFHEIETLDLGEIVTRLIKTTKFPELFIPPPLQIKINQLRNIAYHHNYKLVNNDIVLWYGKGRNRKEIAIPKGNILKIAEIIFNCYKLHNLSYTIFFIDNIEDIKKLLPNKDYEHRFEAFLVNFASGIASQGFEIINIEKFPKESKLIVKDLTDNNSDERCVHASQFLYSLWLMTKSDKLIVEYRENDGSPKVLFKINSDVCEKYQRGEIEFHGIPSKMEIVILKRNQ